MATEQSSGADPALAVPAESMSPVSALPGFDPGEGEPRKKKFPGVRHVYLKRGAGQLFAVMCEGGGLPTVLHTTFDRAAFQAAKLAHENPGHRFHVLASQRVSFAEPLETEAEAA